MFTLVGRALGRSQVLRLLAAASLFYFTVLELKLYVQYRRNENQTSNKVSAAVLDDDGCDELGSFDQILVTVKTGATEAAEKLPIQLGTTLRCVPTSNILWFSDMAQTFDGHRVFDSLDAIPASAMTGNPDFDIYRKQQEIGDPVEVMKLLKSMKSPKDPNALAAWSLDKYKNIHILEKTWYLKPNIDWYFHIDADTYVIWSSLLAWIRKLDSTKESYMGSVACVGTPFLHGGSGYLLSKAATKSLVVTHNGTANRWYERTISACCGDWILAQALKELGIGSMNAWPTVNGETPATIRFQSDNWCQPLVTMHHVSSDEAVQLEIFEQKRANKTAPVLYAELFRDLVMDLIPRAEGLVDWDNKSNGINVPGIESGDDCIEACRREDMCLQSLFNKSGCFLGTAQVTFGERHVSGSEISWQSSWNRTRIADWVAKQVKCGVVTFPFEDGKTSQSSDSACSGS